ncbi:hypothetical protein ACRQ5D_24640 [Mucilaginibacter sp. P25]|uniref:hypothetical protein n=1 Tax=unclassified Mucilaginibacter TaxID=2617802 RepID=UPI003D67645C
MQAEIGVGHAGLIEELEITWAGSHSVQRFRNLKVNQFYHITEGKGKVTLVQLKKLSINNMAMKM